jgi:iron complex transport system permease protein
VIRFQRGQTWRRLWVLIVLPAAALLLVAMVAVYLGSVRIPLDAVIKIILSRLPGVDILPSWTSSQESIILFVRLPRTVAAVLVGAGLAVAGVIFQALLRNPLADPYIIGTSAGAGLGATIAVYLAPYVALIWLRLSLTSLLAFTGAMTAVLVVYGIARVGKRTPVTTLVLAGFALGAMLSAIIHFLMLLNDTALIQVTLWLMGSVSSVTWQQVVVVSPIILISIVVAYFFATDLNAFLLGDEQAAHIGVNVQKRKLFLIFLGSLITAAGVSISGLIGFVGLVVPHVMRLLLGPDHRLLLPVSAAAGGLFLTLADLLARTVLAPGEIPVGIVTAVVGAPFFIYLLRRRKQEYSF